MILSRRWFVLMLAFLLPLLLVISWFDKQHDRKERDAKATQWIEETTMECQYSLTAITVLIGVFVAFTGWQQYQINKERFKLDLFEKRFAVYKGAQVFLTGVLSGAKVEMAKFLEFRAETQDAKFLFDRDVTDFLAGIDSKALEIWKLREELQDLPKEEERSRLCREQTEATKSLMDNLSKLTDVFGPYLRFRTWK